VFISRSDLHSSKNLNIALEFTKDFYEIRNWHMLERTGNAYLIMEPVNPEFQNVLMVTYGYGHDYQSLEIAHYIFENEDEKWEFLKKPFYNSFWEETKQLMGGIENGI
jgi:hypothetical protein